MADFYYRLKLRAAARRWIGATFGERRKWPSAACSGMMLRAEARRESLFILKNKKRPTARY